MCGRTQAGAIADELAGGLAELGGGGGPSPARGPLALPAGTPGPAPGGAARDAQASPCMLAAAVLQAGLAEGLLPFFLPHSRS